MTKIKICGLQTAEDVDAVNKVQPEYAGFVFAASKRQVTDAQANGLRQQLSKEITSVGVFVNDSIAHIASLCSSKVINLIQLHGTESEAYVRAVQEATGIPVIKAARIASKEAAEEVLKTRAEYLLYDAFAGAHIYGGSGTVIDTSFIPKLVRPVFLAGGLTAENVEQVIKDHQPFCVDVSSGVEVNGKKEYYKIKEFVERVRAIGGSGK